jgi:hypothetical protein
MRNVEVYTGHTRLACPDCFSVLQECACGGSEKTTFWRLCDICMKKDHELEKLADEIPEGKLLDARLVFKKILPIMNFPKEFIPVRLHPGYDQWKERLLLEIHSSAIAEKGEVHERSEGQQRADSGDQNAERGGVCRDKAAARGEGAGE